MERVNRVTCAALVLCGGAITGTTNSHATSGPGCLRVVNISPGDTLNVRSRPSASARIVDQMAMGAHGVIHLDAECTPKSRPWGQRWCPVTHYNGDRTTSGYVKARYVRDNECP